MFEYWDYYTWNNVLPKNIHMIITVRATMFMVKAKSMNHLMHNGADAHAPWALEVHVLKEQFYILGRLNSVIKILTTV